MNLRQRFPGLADGWARFDGPAGTQMVDSAMDAMTDHLRSGRNANSHGLFSASQSTDEMVERARATVGRLLGAEPEGVVFGANSTSLLLAFSRSVGLTLGPGDEVVCTCLDHDANITPWALTARDAGASVLMAPIDAKTGRFEPDAVIDLIGERTRWVAVTGASNAIGTVPDLSPIVSVAHEAGARVLVDAVHLAPHRRIDISAIGCDALVTSPYKWYGPHAGILWARPSLLAQLEAYKVRPAPDVGPARFETGTPCFEALAATTAAAEFLLETDLETIGAYEAEVFSTLMARLLEMAHVTVHGPTGLDARTPTVAFTVDGLHPDEVAVALANRQVAVWSGDYYAVEVMAALGLGASGGAVRAGVVGYTTPDDVEQLLRALASLA